MFSIVALLFWFVLTLFFKFYFMHFWLFLYLIWFCRLCFVCVSLFCIVSDWLLPCYWCYVCWLIYYNFVAGFCFGLFLFGVCYVDFVSFLFYDSISSWGCYVVGCGLVVGWVVFVILLFRCGIYSCYTLLEVLFTWEGCFLLIYCFLFSLYL